MVVAAAIQPSTWAAERAPTIAPVTPGQQRVHATATAATVIPCRSAIGFKASRSARFRSSLGGWNSSARRRQSSVASAAMRSAEKRSVRSPACMGL